MKTIELSLARIGNSRGIRLPVDLIRKHSLEPGVILEDRGHELVLRPKDSGRRLSWEQTAREMAAAVEDWSDWEGVGGDGLESAPWREPKPSGESPAKSENTPPPARRKR